MKKGFTLVELLAVVVILSIILAIAVPTITSIVNNSKHNSFESTAKLFLNAVKIKMLENNGFDLRTINVNTLESLLNIDNDNFSQVYVRSDSNGKLYLTLKGTGKWSNLTAIGSLDSMSVSTTESIVTDGLVSYLDGGNLSSYNGSGTTWYDISGNNNNAILYNGVQYTVGNGGALIFDGTNDYADIPIPQSLSSSTITIEGFIKWNSLNIGMFFGMTSYDIWTSTGALGFNTAENNLIGIPSTTVSSLGLLGNYKHYAFIMNKNGLVSANKIYINGVLQSMIVVKGSDALSPGFNSNLRLSGWNNTTGYNASVNFGTLRVYNKELTGEEILQNYNAQKVRYGI